MTPVDFIETFFRSRIGETITQGLINAAAAVAEQEAPAVIDVLVDVLSKRLDQPLTKIAFAALSAAASALVAEIAKPAESAKPAEPSDPIVPVTPVPRGPGRPPKAAAEQA